MLYACMYYTRRNDHKLLCTFTFSGLIKIASGSVWLNPGDNDSEVSILSSVTFGLCGQYLCSALRIKALSTGAELSRSTLTARLQVVIR